MRRGYRFPLVTGVICVLVLVRGAMAHPGPVRLQDGPPVPPTPERPADSAVLPPALAPFWRPLAVAVPRDLLGRRLRLAIHESSLPELVCHEEALPLPPGEMGGDPAAAPPERLLCSLSTTLLAGRPGREAPGEEDRGLIVTAALAHAAVHALEAVETRLAVISRKAKNRRRLVGLFSWVALIAGGAGEAVTLGEAAAPWLLFYGRDPHHRSPPDHAAGSVPASLHRYGLEPDPYLAHRITRRREAVARLVAIERIVDTKAAILLKRAGVPVAAQLRLYELLARYRITNLHRWPGFDRAAPNALLEAAYLRAEAPSRESP